jgi:hypothetical protein
MLEVEETVTSTHPVARAQYQAKVRTHNTTESLSLDLERAHPVIKSHRK